MCFTSLLISLQSLKDETSAVLHVWLYYWMLKQVIRQAQKNTLIYIYVKNDQLSNSHWSRMEGTWLWQIKTRFSVHLRLQRVNGGSVIKHANGVQDYFFLLPMIYKCDYDRAWSCKHQYSVQTQQYKYGRNHLLQLKIGSNFTVLHVPSLYTVIIQTKQMRHDHVTTVWRLQSTQVVKK